MATATTVHGRLDQARTELTLAQLALGLALVVVTGLALLALQDPLVHDSLHTFRHGAGVVCH